MNKTVGTAHRCLRIIVHVGLSACSTERNGHNMKKKITVITGIITAAVMMTAITASAKVVYPKSVSEEIRNGKSVEDACSAISVLVLGGENVPMLIYKKHDELGSWEKTAEYYNLNMERFKANIRQYQKEIPDDVYEDMKSSGLTDEECYDFARRSSNVQLDIAVTWEANKNGKTINDLVKENTARKNAKLQAAVDFVFGKISQQDYTEKMKLFSPNMKVVDMLSFAREEERGWREFRRAATGISDEELKAAAAAGITDFFAACRLKESETLTNKTFTEMLGELGEDKDVDKVIRDNISAEKDR